MLDPERKLELDRRERLAWRAYGVTAVLLACFCGYCIAYALHLI